MKYTSLLVLCLATLSINACSMAPKQATEPKLHKQEVTTKTLQPRSTRSLYLGAQTAMHNGQPTLAIQFLEALLAQQSSKASPLQELHPRLQLADLLLKSNRPLDARAYLQAPIEQITLNSKNSVEQKNLYLLYARTLAANKQYDDAIDILVKLLNQHPSFIPARHLQITLFILTNKFSLAHVAINIAIKQQDTPRLRQFQADAFTREGKFQQAFNSLKAMHALNPKDDTAILLLSQLALQQKQPSKAEKVLRTFIEHNPSNLRVQHALARLLIQSQRPKEAILIYKRMSKQLPNSAEIASALGLLHYQEQAFKEASQYFKQALQITPANKDYVFYLASSLEALQKNKQARVLYKKVNAQDAFWKDAQLRLASMDFTNKQYASSEQYIQHVIQKYPNDKFAWGLLSTLYLAQEKYQQLLDKTQPATLLKDTSARVQMNRAIAFEHFKRYDDVEKTLQALIQTNPNHADALNFLAYTYAEQGIKLDQAKAYIQRALKQKPKDGYYLDSLAWIYYKNGEYDKAIHIQQEALQIINDDSTMYNHLGDMLWKKGNKEQAILQWQKALTLKPKNASKLHEKIKYGLQ